MIREKRKEKRSLSGLHFLSLNFMDHYFLDIALVNCVLAYNLSENADSFQKHHRSTNGKKN